VTRKKKDEEKDMTVGDNVYVLALILSCWVAKRDERTFGYFRTNFKQKSENDKRIQAKSDQ